MHPISAFGASKRNFIGWVKKKAIHLRDTFANAWICNFESFDEFDYINMLQKRAHEKVLYLKNEWQQKYAFWS